jgi:hypothetical protein
MIQPYQLRREFPWALSQNIDKQYVSCAIPDGNTDLKVGVE